MPAWQLQHRGPAQKWHQGGAGRRRITAAGQRAGEFVPATLANIEEVRADVFRTRLNRD